MTQTPTDALRLVPVEPTEEMIEAGNRALSSWIAPAMHAGDAYAAMIKEIPTVVPTMPNRDGIAERIFDCPEVRGEFDMETARKVADFILAAAPASPLPGGGWQDISTAPKDGTMIWVCEVHPDPKFRARHYEGCYVEASHLGCLLSGEESPRFHNRSANCWAKPTHWMPLLAAPTGEPK